MQDQSMPAEEARKTFTTYQKLESEIKKNDKTALDRTTDAVIARWEFGRLLLEEKGVSKQLANNRRKEIAEAVGIASAEIGFRMKLAVKYENEDEVATAVATYGTWSSVRAHLKLQADPDPRHADEHAAAVREAEDHAEFKEAVADDPNIKPPMSVQATALQRALREMQKAANEIEDIIASDLLQPFAVYVAELNPTSVKNQCKNVRGALGQVEMCVTIQQPPRELRAPDPSEDRNQLQIAA